MRRTIFRRPQIGILDGGGLLVIGGTSFVLLARVFAERDPNRWLAVGLLVAMLAAMLLRDPLVVRRGAWMRYAYAAVQTALVCGLFLAVPNYYFAGFILFFRLSPEAMMLFRPRVAYAWLGLFTVITLVVALWREGPGGALMLPVYFGGYLFFALFARQTAEAEEARCESQRLLAELQTAHRQLQEYATQAEELAVAQERNRLAREVHDTLGHRLTVSAVQLQAAEKLIASDPQRAQGMVGAVRGEVRTALDELRATVAALRAPVEADLALAPALRRMAATFEHATGLTVHLLLPEPLPALPPAHRQALYRAAQEGLTNIQKHARAGRAWVQLTLADREICLIVRDDGRGPVVGGQGESAEPGAAGFGLAGLRERATLLGGSASLEARAGGGAQLVVTLPLPPEDQNV